MIIIATIPVGLAGVALEHTFRTIFSKPILTALVPVRERVDPARPRVGAAAQRGQGGPGDRGRPAGDRRTAEGRGGGGNAGRRRTAFVRAAGDEAAAREPRGGSRPAYRPPHRAGRRFDAGASQILALLPGISRDGTVMVAGMFRGLTRQDAARFSFLLSAPVILAAAVPKIPDLTGPLGAGDQGTDSVRQPAVRDRRLPRAQFPGPLLQRPEAHAGRRSRSTAWPPASPSSTWRCGKRRLNSAREAPGAVVARGARGRGDGAAPGVGMPPPGDVRGAPPGWSYPARAAWRGLRWCPWRLPRVR